MVNLLIYPPRYALISSLMTNALKSYINEYTQLEAGIQKLVLEKCAPLCTQCTAICCDKVMCVEAIQSPFLKRIHEQTEEFDEENGFLTPTGCLLKKGRPSVCYEYFCDNHFYYQPDDQHAEVLQSLGSLLFHATRNAKGDVPLDEVPAEDLDHLDFDRLTSQLQESMLALHTIQTFFNEGTITQETFQTLKTIRIPDEFDSAAEASARQ
jgi:hypothetical protein